MCVSVCKHSDGQSKSIFLIQSISFEKITLDIQCFCYIFNFDCDIKNIMYYDILIVYEIITLYFWDSLISIILEWNLVYTKDSVRLLEAEIVSIKY